MILKKQAIDGNQYSEKSKSNPLPVNMKSKGKSDVHLIQHQKMRITYRQAFSY